MTASPRIIFCQPALPSYRNDYFARLAAHWGSRFRLYYSRSNLGVLTGDGPPPSWASVVGSARPLLGGRLEWQPGIVGLSLERGDVLILSGGPRTLSTLVLAVRARLKGARIIWFGHYWSESTKPWRFALRMALMRIAHAVLFYTDLEVQEYRAGIGRFDRRPVSAINNGLAIEPIIAARRAYRAAERGHELLFIGRTTAKAQLGLLFEALATEALADVRLHIIGAGAEKPSLITAAECLGIASRIVWHEPTVNEERIGEVAGRCRLFVYPGRLGLSLIHAMGHGLPAVVNHDRRANNPEIAAFTDGVTGLAFRQDDVRDLASTIKRALADDALLDCWSQSALERAEETYNTRGMAARTVALAEMLSPLR
jgi:glycosyltransferase involved in cell wall biosynthesis